ncbi:hypothetical protein CK203_101798 [Vitis vinifera]|uniref:Uncharacterized protein n=1 Tax=Vitis vinifera TaxID=29760 RepID=A0A438FFY3_VITVI|nr:hypothetical protein CK203_101798 [Vitis vinifera]
MAKTRGVKSSSPSNHLRAPRETPMQGSMTEPSQPLVISSSVEDAPLSPPSRRYETRRPPTIPRASSSRPKKLGSRPPKKKARVSTPLESSKPPSEPQPPQPPATESQIPSGMTSEVVSGDPWLSQSLEIPSICCRAYGAKERSFARGIVQDIRGIFLWTSSSHYGMLFCTLKRRSIEEAVERGCHSTFIPEIAMSDFRALGISI